MNLRTDPYKYFRIEARELIAQLLHALPELHHTPGNAALLARALRLAHTLKGAALVVKQREIAELAHALEDGLLPYRQGTAVPVGQPERLGSLLRAMERRVNETLPPARSAAPAAGEDDLLSSARVEIAELDGLLGEVEETQVQLQGVHRAIVGLAHAGRLASVLARGLSQAGSSEQPIAPTGDDLCALADELDSVLPRLRDGLGDAVERVERELRQLHEKADHIRLLPVATLFSEIERAALETANTLGKRVSFSARGGQVRLSAEVLSTLRPALVQLARNAVAHGVEASDTRRRLGKDEVGHVDIEVRRRGHAITLVCSDDGAGVDLDAVAHSARRAGHGPEEVDGMGRDPLLGLLLRERISTSHCVTNAAGRGVGMDVVRDAVERLSAQISMRTQTGLGSSFELVVPISLAALDALIVQSGTTRVAIPLDAVERTSEVRAGDVAQTAQGQSAWLDHSSIPFAHLREALIPDGLSPLTDAPHALVVVRAGQRLAAIGVDGVHGTSRIVVRPLPRLAPASPVIGGVAIDSHGDPQLVIDPEGLLSCTCKGMEGHAP